MEKANQHPSRKKGARKPGRLRIAGPDGRPAGEPEENVLKRRSTLIPFFRPAGVSLP